MSEANLADIRLAIDQADERLIEALAARMRMVEQVAQYKAEHNLPILDEQRECAVIDDRTRLGQAAGLPSQGTRELFELVMRLSRDRQRELMDASARAAQSAPRVAAFQGVPGANSHVALTHLLGRDMESVHYETFEEVFAAVEDGSAVYGVLPIENSYAGSVTQVYDLLGKSTIHIIGEVSLPVSHALMAVPGTCLERIEKVYSHEQALAQCRPFFDAHPEIKAEPFYNTAGAAQLVAGKNDPSIAALANEYAAELYGLEILEPALEASGDNSTRFLLVARRPYSSADANKASVRFTLAHVPGSLALALQHFADHGLNMVKIESRPLRDRSFEYAFYVDFEGAGVALNLHRALAVDQTLFADVRILGAYRVRKSTGE